MKKIILAVLCTLALSISAQTTAFTYQGRLTINGTAANGNYDLQFILFATNQFGNPVGPILTNANVSVASGLFTTRLDFGAGIFTGTNYWLEIYTRTNGNGSFTVLTPRQLITPTPYALNAASATTATTAANVTGSISDSQLSANIPRLNSSASFTAAVSANSFIGNGALVTNVNAAALNGLAATNFWQLGGNNVSNGQFFGTTNNQALDVRVNNMRVLRMEWPVTAGPLIGGSPDTLAGAPNMIGGAPINYVGTNIQGATIAGGGATNYFGTPLSNTVMAAFGTIGGGYDNTILSNAFCATISGGAYNRIDTNGFEAFIGGGYWNTLQSNAFRSIIIGGTWNTIGVNSGDAMIGSGAYNLIQSDALHSIVVGGTNNVILSGANDSLIASGGFNTNGAHHSAIVGGYKNAIQTNAYQSFIGGGNLNLIQNSAWGSVIAGGDENMIQTNADRATIDGGYLNLIQTNAYGGAIGGGRLNVIQIGSYNGVIGGGSGNTIGATSQFSTIGGGFINNIQSNAIEATIAGGFMNTNTGPRATIPGGDQNVAGTNSFAAGHRAKATHAGSFVWADLQEADFSTSATNQFLIRATNGVGINKNNPATALDVNGTITATSFSAGGNTVWNAGNDGAGSGLDADLLDGLNSVNFWKTGGNSGSSPGTDFIGTSDNQALEFKVNGLRALRLEPNTNSPNVIGGYSGNYVAPGITGATIAGGGTTGGASNRISADYAVISGGYKQVIQNNANYSTIAGGYLNTIETNALASKIGGGELNTIQVDADHAIIGGGNFNTIQSNANYAIIGGGYLNTIQTNVAYAIIGGGAQNSIQIGSGYSIIGGGFGNIIQNNASDSVIGGGAGNIIQTNSNYSTIGGGQQSTIQSNAYRSTIAGGGLHIIERNAQLATIGGGYVNIAGGVAATVPGGYLNIARGDYSFAAGRQARATNDGAFVWADTSTGAFSSTATNQFLIRASGGVGINTNNPGATLDVNGSLRVNSGTVFTDLLAGQAVMPGGATTSKTNITITFPKAFSSTPKIVATINADPGWDVDDTFVASVRKVTTTNCVVNIVRVDSASGWSQILRVNWMAWQ